LLKESWKKMNKKNCQVQQELNDKVVAKKCPMLARKSKIKFKDYLPSRGFFMAK